MIKELNEIVARLEKAAPKKNPKTEIAGMIKAIKGVVKKKVICLEENEEDYGPSFQWQEDMMTATYAAAILKALKPFGVKDFIIEGEAQGSTCEIVCQINGWAKLFDDYDDDDDPYMGGRG